MPELTVLQIGLLAGALIVGVVIGWFIRADRCAKEKIAVNASWQDQLESQQSEHSRLAEQNKSLMEQISQYQASHKDHTNRAKALSESLKEAFARRDELQRQLKDTRAKLELAVVQRNQAREALELRPAEQSVAMKEKDDKIFKLSRELTSWQSRVPPLVERFQTRDAEARALEEELEKTRNELQALEERVRSDSTRIEPVDADSLPDGGDASNEPIALTATHETAALQDQIDNGIEEIDELEDFVDPVEEEDLRPVDGGEDLEDVFAAEQDSEVNEDNADDEDVAAEERGDDSQSSWVTRGPPTDGSDVEPGVADEDVAVNIFDPQAGNGLAGDDADTYGNPQQTEVGAESFAGNGQMPHATAVGDVESAKSDNDRDNLQKIKGIGPSIERTLNDLGVYRFHQIAEMSEYDIDRVAQQLKGFRSRIYREDWIGQARDLQYEKNNRRS
jgi:predicted flap endonuclease-1-like 5' DNA nuclease/predicted  nucleic acid-binding Zn-ribbon protein